MSGSFEGYERRRTNINTPFQFYTPFFFLAAAPVGKQSIFITSCRSIFPEPGPEMFDMTFSTLASLSCCIRNIGAKPFRKSFGESQLFRPAEHGYCRRI